MPQWYPYSESHPHLSVVDSLNAIVEYLNASGSETLIASTRVIIAPGYKYKIVDALITNFHLPKSTLIMLVSALYDREKILEAYKEAVEQKYRFFSYGDAMLIK